MGRTPIIELVEWARMDCLVCYVHIVMRCDAMRWVTGLKMQYTVLPHSKNLVGAFGASRVVTSRFCTWMPPPQLLLQSL